MVVKYIKRSESQSVTIYELKTVPRSHLWRTT